SKLCFCCCVLYFLYGYSYIYLIPDISVSLNSWRTACNLLFHLSVLPSIERTTSNNYNAKRSTDVAYIHILDAFFCSKHNTTEEKSEELELLLD
ncbi:hypothetical protein C0J52_28233, partial [Blattella germanica]